MANFERLYCILDDLRKDAPHINWSMPRAQLVVDHKFAIPIRMRERSRTIGKVDIGERHKNWLYSKALFADRSIEDNIQDLIQRAMIGD